MQLQRLGHLALAAAAGLCSAARAQAGPVPLAKDDVALAIYASADGKTYAALDAATLAGFFGPHRCACPVTLSVGLVLTPTGQTNLGTSVLGVTFLLGQNCPTSPASCQSLGSVNFSASQAASPPAFSSNLIFQSTQGTASVSCTSLTAAATTIYAVLTQDNLPLSFTPDLQIPVIAATVGAPTDVKVQPASQGLLVSWSPPSDASLVTGYQILCLPRPAAAHAPGYESCGLVSTGTAVINPADATQICSDVLSASTTSVRLSGLVDAISYTVAVIAIDVSGGISAPSLSAAGTPQPTDGFWERYKQAGGAASGCSVVPSSAGRGSWLFFLLALVPWLMRRRYSGKVVLVAFLSAAMVATTAFGQAISHSDDWARADVPPPSVSPLLIAPEWLIEVGFLWYRPAIDEEMSSGSRPFADTFSDSRRPMWMIGLERHVLHRFGTASVGLRVGYYKVSSQAFLAGTDQRSGDQTSLRLIPLSPSLIYRANGLPGLWLVPLIPYAKVGLDATYWTVDTSGARGTQSGISLGWHGAVGLMLGLVWLSGHGPSLEGLADPCALFFEWNYAAINGLGMAHSLHVGDNTWSAGLMFDL